MHCETRRALHLLETNILFVFFATVIFIIRGIASRHVLGGTSTLVLGDSFFFVLRIFAISGKTNVYTIRDLQLVYRGEVSRDRHFKVFTATRKSGNIPVLYLAFYFRDFRYHTNCLEQFYL